MTYHRLKNIILLTCLMSLTTLSMAAPTPQSDTAIQNAILKRINQYRQLHGLQALKMDSRIVKEAKKHSQDMATHKLSFGHQHFMDRVKHLKAQIKPSGGMAENVAYNYPNADSVVKGWLNSAGHRRNIDGGRYRLTGIGVAPDAQGRLYFTQIFVA